MMQSFHLNASWFQAFLRISTLKSAIPKRMEYSSNHHFSDAMLVLGQCGLVQFYLVHQQTAWFSPKCHPPKERTSIFYTWCLHIIWMCKYIYTYSIYICDYMCIMYTCVLICLKTPFPPLHMSMCFLQFSSCLTCIVPHVALRSLRLLQRSPFHKGGLPTTS